MGNHQRTPGQGSNMGVNDQVRETKLPLKQVVKEIPCLCSGKMLDLIKKLWWRYVNSH